MPLPDPADFGLKETPKDAAVRLAAKLNPCAFPLEPTVDFFAKVLNSVHAFIPKSLDGVLDSNEDSVALRRTEQAFNECVHFLQDYPALSQNEVECERFLQTQMRKIRSLGVGVRVFTSSSIMSAKCASCGKTAYPLESVTALEKQYHKSCFKCDVCSTTLNLKNFKGFEGKIYCFTHTPKVKGGPIGTDSISVKSATSVPKKDVAQGVHKADAKVAPQRSNDFSTNSAGDQSTENNPDNSNISYDPNSGDQSTENNPDNSNVYYEQHSGDQSTENNPDASNVYYEQHSGDQSTEGYGNTEY